MLNLKFVSLVSLLSFHGVLCGTMPSWAMDNVETSSSQKANNISRRIKVTSGEEISYIESEGKGTPLVFIHANSASKEIFDKQIEELGHIYKVIAFDLPGHGESDDALDPQAVYSFPGYAKVLIDAMEKMSLRDSVVCGLSLGGHVAMEMLQQRPDLLSGIVITGSPPIPPTPEGMKMGFKPFPGIEMMSQESQFTKEESEKFLKMGGFEPTEILIKHGMRTDGKARSHMIKSIIEGAGSNQKEVIENSPKPFAIVCGSQDEGINNDYIKNGISYNQNLFKIFTLDSGHAVNVQNPQEFNLSLKEFMEFVSKNK